MLVQDIWVKQTNLKTNFEPDLVLNLIRTDERFNEGVLG